MPGDGAALYGLYDCGIIAPGFQADLNVIHHASARVSSPHLIQDLPAEGRRVMQRVTASLERRACLVLSFYADPARVARLPR